MKNIIERSSALVFALVLVFASFAHSQTVSPFQGLGNAQFFDNNGAPLTSGVLYSYIAGSSTQQATYTDATGTAQNPNPLPFTSGARASIWLTTGALYKFVLCSQNDGAFCSPFDVLYSVDQVPSGGAGGGSASSPFVGTFISGTANPASSGIVRMASGDTWCFRNVAGSANLCWSKDPNDLLSWDGGSLKFPEVNAPSGVALFDIIWADSTAHRWKMKNNNGTAAQIVGSGVDINTSDQVNQLHFGSTATPLCNTAPTLSQSLQWNGTSYCGGVIHQPVYATPSAATQVSIPVTTMITVGGSSALYRFSPYFTVTIAAVGCSVPTYSVALTFTDPNASVSSSVGMGTVQIFNGILGPATTSANQPLLPMTFRAKAGTVIQYSVATGGAGGCSTVPTYQLYPVLEQLTVN